MRPGPVPCRTRFPRLAQMRAYFRRLGWIALDSVQDWLDWFGKTARPDAHALTRLRDRQRALGLRVRPELEALEIRWLPTTVQFASTTLSVNENIGTASLSVSLDAASSQDVTVHYSTSDGTAVANGDYTATSGTLTIPHGSTGGAVLVSIVDDSLDEDDETFTCTLSSPTNATLGANTVDSVTIQDNDPSPTVALSSSTYSVNENAGNATITVNLSTASGRSVSVHYATSDGSAVAGSDYTAASGTASVAAGSTSTTFTVPITDDDVSESSETINLTLSSPTNATLGSPSTGTLTITNVSPSTWLPSGTQLSDDPLQSSPFQFGLNWLSPQTGDVHIEHPLDVMQSSGTSGLDDSTTSVFQPALVYNSSAVNVKPIVQVTLPGYSSDGVPSQISVQLTWNGTSQSAVVFSTSGHSAGDTYALSSQVSSAVSGSGLYPWSVKVVASFGSRGDVSRTVTGTLPVLDESNSAFGPGWTVGGVDRLFGDSTGMVWEYGIGGYRFFSYPGSGSTYTSPANDMGTLVQNVDLSYTYTAKDQTQYNFSTTGRLTGIVDPHGLRVTLTYSGTILSTIAEPDGGSTSFSNDGTYVTKVTEPGSRVVTLTHDATSHRLTAITNPDGNARNFTYDSSSRLTNDQFGPTNATFTYDSTKSVLSSADTGGSSTLSLTPAVVQGLASSPAISTSKVLGILTDANSKVTTYQFDTVGRLTLLLTPDGATQNWTLDSAGQPTVYADGLNRVTTYTFAYGASKGDLTQITYPDGNSESFQYDSTYHHLTQSQDTLGNRTTYQYSSQGDLTTITNALAQVTKESWSSGLLQSIADANSHITTYVYTGRLLQTAIDALGDRTTYGYDNAGNQNYVQDALGRVTSSVFDGLRRLTQQTDAGGGILTLAYNALGEVTTQTDQLGHSTQFGYDVHGWQITQTDALSKVTTTAYDVQGRVSTQTDANNHVTSFSYDAMGRQLTQTNADGGVTTNAYDAAGQLTTVTDARGNVTVYGYNNRGWQVTTKDALNNVTTTVYDSQGNVTATVDALNRRTSFTYDALNRQYQTQDALGNYTTTVFDSVGNTSATVDQLGRRTSFSYDALNRQIQVQDGLGNLASTVYDAVGNATVQIDPLGHRTSYAFDSMNRVTTVTNALAGVAVTTYDKAGNVLTEKDELGKVTTYLYDALNRRTQTQNAVGDYATVSYDAVGNVLFTINEKGKSTSFTYDAMNRQISRQDALGKFTYTSYDKSGNVLTTTDELGYVTSLSYDALNRNTQTQDALGNYTTTVYDAVGNVSATVDALGHRTSFSYDALNRQTQVQDALTHFTTTTYDAVGNTTSVKDSVGNVTTMVYDVLNRLTQQTDPLNHSAPMAYDAAGRETSATDRNGNRRDYTYDNLNRKTGETWVVSGSTSDRLTFTYDAVGNLLTAANGNGTYTMTYDGVRRLKTQQGPFGSSLTFSYNKVDDRTVVNDAFGGTATYSYNNVEELTEIDLAGIGGAQLRINFGYTDRGELSSETRWSDLAGTTKVGSSAFTYDAVGNLTNLKHKNASNTVLANYTYTYDAARRLGTETDNGTLVTYSYDNTNQLTGDGTRSYSYDANGNRTMTGYSTGTGNQLTSDGTWTMSYDSEGNLTKKTKGASAETWTYGYDNANRLTWVEKRATDGGTLQLRVDFKYDVFGNRIEKDVDPDGAGPSGTTTQRFMYDGNMVYADVDGSNALQTRYLYGNQVDQLFARVSAGGTSAWYLTDHLGSVRDVTDNIGVVQDHIDYDPCGCILTETNSGFGDRYKYTGREWDSEIGLQFNRARFYDPVQGRWLGQDPLTFDSGDTNLYRYVSNDPTNLLDPNGAQALANQAMISLQIRQVTDATAGYWGAFAWPVNFVVNPAPNTNHGGWIVQHVRITAAVRNFAGVNVLAGDPHFAGPQLDYWEAWKVEQNRTSPATYGLPPDERMRFWQIAKKNSKMLSIGKPTTGFTTLTSARTRLELS